MFRPNYLKTPDVAYWLGVLHSDGKRICYRIKRCGRVYTRWEIALAVKQKSLPMIINFVRIFHLKFGRQIKIHRLSDGKYKAGTSVKSLLSTLKGLEISFDGTCIPSWISEDRESFGAYLAGLVDGDGDIRVKGYRRRTPQCCIRISDGRANYELKKAVEQNFGCDVSIYKRSKSHVYEGRVIRGSWFSLEFVVSKKNLAAVVNCLLPWIAIPHKRLKLEQYLLSWCPGGVARSNSGVERPRRPNMQACRVCAPGSNPGQGAPQNRGHFFDY